MKRCARCRLEKPANNQNFGNSKAAKDGFHSYCRPCEAAKAREYRERNREHVRARAKAEYAKNKDKYLERNRASLYGLKPGQYADMLEAQGGVCAICEQVCESGNSLAVDHDHSCCPERKSCGNCVRALLCLSCNRGLAAFRDDPNRLRAAALYLERG